MPESTTSAQKHNTASRKAEAHRHRVSVTRRIVIADVRPHVENGRYALRRVVGDVIPVTAEVLCDGNATLRACLLARPQNDTRWRPAPMQPRLDARGVATPTWSGLLRLQQGGLLQYCIEAWIDVFATWVEAMQRLMTQEGASSPPLALVEEGENLLAAAMTRATGADLKLLAECHDSLRASAGAPSRLRLWFANRQLHKRMLVHGERRHVVRSEPVLSVEAARRRAAFVIGCHLRASQGLTHAAVHDLRQIGAEMLQVGVAHPADDWPHGIDRAETVTLPRAPEASWFERHPQWFVVSPTQSHQGKDRCVDFWCEERDALWDACLAVLQGRVRQGVGVFVAARADQVPLPFWEWVIRRIRQRHPEVLFVSEPLSAAWARALSRVGFDQVQVAWDDSLEEAPAALQHLQGLNHVEWRPLLTVPVQSADGADAESRQLVQLLAATTCGRFALRGLPTRPSEVAWLRLLNRLRQENHALQVSGNVRLLRVDSPHLLAVHRHVSGGRNDLVIVVNCRPHQPVEAQVCLPDVREHPEDEPTVLLEDLLDGQRYEWQVGDNYVRLGPGLRQAHVLRVVRRSRLFA